MSAVIEIVGADANGFMPAYPQLLEVPPMLAEFDQRCGTSVRRRPIRSLTLHEFHMSLAL